MGPASANVVHLMTEAMKRSYPDRALKAAPTAAHPTAPRRRARTYYGAEGNGTRAMIAS